MRSEELGCVHGCVCAHVWGCSKELCACMDVCVCVCVWMCGYAFVEQSLCMQCVRELSEPSTGVIRQGFFS